MQPSLERRPAYDPNCYLCPGNTRANGERNPDYSDTFVFTNDFSSLLPDTAQARVSDAGLLIAKSERGICRVVNFSPRHDLTLAEMDQPAIEKVVTTWQNEFAHLAADKRINHIQIFENKGAMMGNSNPHPHCQIWAQENIPGEAAKELRQFSRHYAKYRRSLLVDYAKLELHLNERIVYTNDSFIVLVPFWAVWPFETMIVPRRKLPTIMQFRPGEKKDFADALRVTAAKYDNLFKTSFPYSSGLHQAPTDGRPHPEWHCHMHFYPPLLRSASVKKFMVGYEMLAEPQRDQTPERAAEVLRKLPTAHHSRTTG